MTDQFEPETPEEIRVHRVGVLNFFLHWATISTLDDLIRDQLATETGEERTAEEKWHITDATKQAVRALVGKGILHMEGTSIYATRAAKETVRLVHGVNPPDDEL